MGSASEFEHGFNLAKQAVARTAHGDRFLQRRPVQLGMIELKFITNECHVRDARLPKGLGSPGRPVQLGDAEQNVATALGLSDLRRQPALERLIPLAEMTSLEADIQPPSDLVSQSPGKARPQTLHRKGRNSPLEGTVLSQIGNLAAVRTLEYMDGPPSLLLLLRSGLQRDVIGCILSIGTGCSDAFQQGGE